MGHAEAMKVIAFSKYSKLYVDFENAIKFSENLTVLKIIAFEVKPLISVNYDKIACERLSTW